MWNVDIFNLASDEAAKGAKMIEKRFASNTLHLSDLPDQSKDAGLFPEARRQFDL